MKIKTIISILFYLLLLIASYFTMDSLKESVILHKWYGIITILFTFFYSFYKLSSFLVISNQRKKLKKLLKEIEKDIIEGHDISAEHERQLKKYVNEYSGERAREFLRDQSIRERYN